MPKAIFYLLKGDYIVATCGARNTDSRLLDAGGLQQGFEALNPKPLNPKP